MRLIKRTVRRRVRVHALQYLKRYHLIDVRGGILGPESLRWSDEVEDFREPSSALAYESLPE